MKRLFDENLEFALKSKGAVIVVGPKWCGKSTTGLYHSKSVIEFQNPDRQQEYDKIRNTKPSLFLKGEKK